MEKIHEIKCPTCGEKIKYDPKSGMNHCDACGNYYFIDLDKADDNKIDEINKSHCPNCGGELHFEIGTDSVSCTSCGSIFKIAVSEIDDTGSNIGFEPEYIIPFSVTEDQLKNEFIEVLASTDYVPTDVFDKVGFDYIKGYYQPYYRMVVAYEADYTASVGFDRKEQYEDYETVHENGRSYKKRVIKERTVTDWHPISGHTSGRSVLWASGIKNSNDNIAYSPELKDTTQAKNQALIDAYDKIVQQTSNSGKTFNKKYLAGFIATPFSKSETDAWHALENDVHAIINDDVKSQISGDHVKDIRWSSTSRPKHIDTYYVPIWVVSYCYCGNYHTFIANGSNLELNFLSNPQDDASVKKAKQFYLPLKIWGCLIGVYVLLFIIFLFFGPYEIYHPMLYGFPLFLILGLVAWAFGYFGKKNHLSAEKAKRNAEKENIKKDINKFFSRPASYAATRSGSEVTKPVSNDKSNSANQESVNSIKKKSVFPLSKKQKKIAAITIPIAALAVILTVVLTIGFGKSNVPANGSQLNSSNYSLPADSDTSFGIEQDDIEDNTGVNPTIKPDESSAYNSLINSSTGGSAGNQNNSPCAYGHNWVAVTQTVHHDEVGHYETVQDAKKITKYQCAVCYSRFDSLNRYYSHFDNEHSYDSNLALFRDRYETVDDWEYYDTQKWVVDQEAYDETVITGYKCSVCGQAQ